jgi:hypothetical protein
VKKESAKIEQKGVWRKRKTDGDSALTFGAEKARRNTNSSIKKRFAIPDKLKPAKVRANRN